MIVTRVLLGSALRALEVMRRPDLRPAWVLARPVVREDIAAHRKAQVGPDGAWTPRASSTQARARSSRKGRPRRMLGKLPTALYTTPSRTKLATRSRVDWSQVQRAGGVVGHGARIPGRDFLWISDPALARVSEIVERYLAARFDKAG